ncbi:hypothetical protein FH972_009731 [Carpinus fangiana]|uniref:Uncharacterized protein n=1 Tax=Carpinus fangiana TaxID=176857 RepID=A0A660KNV6_9ROSI|nr:hypothetical protein FH972_009731 [Carpinus fangiana]
MCGVSGSAVKKRKPLIKTDKATTLSYSMPGKYSDDRMEMEETPILLSAKSRKETVDFSARVWPSAAVSVRGGPSEVGRKVRKCECGGGRGCGGPSSHSAPPPATSFPEMPHPAAPSPTAPPPAAFAPSSSAPPPVSALTTADDLNGKIQAKLLMSIDIWFDNGVSSLVY